MKEYTIKCPICGHEYLGNYYSICPCCDWMFGGWEENAEDDFYSSENSITLREAKKKVSQGLNIWGNPIKK